MNRALITLGAVLALAAVRVAAQCSSQPLAALAQALPEQEFGRAVALQADDLFVGAAGSPAGTQDFGRVVLFTHGAGGWAPVGELLPPDGHDGRRFGWSLALQGDRLVVGAPGGYVAGVLQGAAYVFDRVGGAWTFTAKLATSDGKIFDSFGSSVALDGGRIVVGAPDADTPSASGAGAAWVFELGPAGWAQVVRLPATGLHQFEHFGISCAISGDTAVVGKAGGSAPLSVSGRAHVFERASDGTWSQTQILKGQDPTHDFFGFDVELQLDTLIVGAPLESLAFPGSIGGAVYHFERVGGAFVQVQRLVAGDPADAEAFGGSLALKGARLAVGSATPGAQDGSAGAVHVYVQDGGPWLRVATADAPPGLLGGAPSFGGCVALAGTRLVASADQDAALGVAAGQAFAFELGALHAPYGDGLPGLGGHVPEVDGTTCTDAGGIDLLLELRLGLGGASCALLAGAQPGTLAFGGGVLLVQPRWRLLPFTLGGPAGVAGVGQLSIAGALPAGTQLTPVFLQLVVADAAAPGGWALSRGLAIPLTP